MNRRTMTSFVNLQMLFLSLTDMLVGFSTIPVTLTWKIVSAFPAFEVCASLFYLYIVPQAASLYHAFGICMHRLIITTRRNTQPVERARDRYKTIFLQILTVWVSSFILVGIPFGVFGRFGETLPLCSLNTIFGESYTLALMLLNIVLLVPHVCMNIVYLYMILFLRRKWKFNTESNIIKTDLSKNPERLTAASDSTDPSTDTTNDVTIDTRVDDVVDHYHIKPKVYSDAERSQQKKTKVAKNQKMEQTYIGRTQTMLQKQKEVLITLGLLLLVLNVFMTPLNLIGFLEVVSEVNLGRGTKFFLMGMAIVNSSLNPVINVCRIKHLRDAVKTNTHKLIQTACYRK